MLNKRKSALLLSIQVIASNQVKEAVVITMNSVLGETLKSQQQTSVKLAASVGELCDANMVVKVLSHFMMCVIA